LISSRIAEVVKPSVKTEWTFEPVSRHAFDCNVLIIGAGPAGLAAACRVMESGLAATVIDDNPDVGGQIWRGEREKQSSRDAAAWFERIRNLKIAVINGARVFQELHTGVLLAERENDVCELNYKKLILATGARERFLPFPGWTLPNVMGAGGLQALVKTGLAIDRKRIVIAGSGPLLLAVGDYLKRKGGEVLLIAEQASRANLLRFGLGLISQSGKASQAYKLKRRLSGVKYLNECWPVAAHGREKLEKVIVRHNGQPLEIDCDYLACGFHLVPNLELAELIGCKIKGGTVSVNEFQQTSIANVYCAGEATGVGGLELSLVEGEIAGLAAAGQTSKARELFAVREKQRKFAQLLSRTFELRNELKSLPADNTIVCRCEDVSFEQLRLSGSWREAKLHSRCGMGPCQGRICGAAVEFLFGWKVESVRPPLFPVRIGSMTGET
jgi:NADPH-dependent 2,4-dienoyl-CoA reductase/sulfur reductase-like enzyme